VEFEFATISGVRFGAGVNSEVYLPSAENLYQFPFINDAGAAGAGNDPMQVLNQMLAGNPAYVQTKEGGNWFCAVCSVLLPFLTDIRVPADVFTRLRA
jgi:hypothetical protein